MGRPGAPWKRVVLKISGEALASDSADEVLDGRVVDRLAREIAEARAELGTEIADRDGRWQHLAGYHGLG